MTAQHLLPRVKEFLHLVRDRRTLAFLILMPSVLTVIFGYAIGSPRVTGDPTRIVDQDGGRIAEEYIEAMDGSITFKPQVVENATDADVAAGGGGAAAATTSAPSW